MTAKSNVGRLGVWGASGSGKSAFTKKRLKGLRRVVVFDPMDEYTPFTRAASVDAVRLAMLRNWGGFTVRYVPPAGRETDALSQLCRLLILAQSEVKETGRGDPLTLVVEEMNLAFPVAGGEQKCPGFAEVCSRGRHSKIAVIGLSQRLAEVSTRFRGNCDETVIFRQKGPRDVQAAMAATGATKEAVSGLRNLDYLHERQGTITKGRLRFK